MALEESNNRPNRVVLHSVEAEDGLRCIDFYRLKDSAILWDEWRRDPEDTRGWYPTGRRSAKGFDTKSNALASAIRTIEWLAD